MNRFSKWYASDALYVAKKIVSLFFPEFRKYFCFVTALEQYPKVVPSFIYGPIPDLVQKKYAGCGVLAFAYDNKQEVQVLLGMFGTFLTFLGLEDRRHKRRAEFSWTIFGGKRTPTEIPRKTAYREWKEETVSSFKGKKLMKAQLSMFIKTYASNSIEHPATPKLYMEDGRYVLYFVEVSYEDNANIPEKFEEKKKEAVESNHLQLRWVNLKHIIECIQKP